jgi:hypothetical protein
MAAEAEQEFVEAPPAPADTMQRHSAKKGMAGSRAPGVRIVSPRTVDIFLDPGAEVLGAYTIELRYDPAAVEVYQILPAGPQGFPGAPMSDPETYKSGVTRILGLHTSGALRQGKVPVARVTFRPRRQGTSSVSTSILGLYNAEGKAIPGTSLLSTRKIIALGTSGR